MICIASKTVLSPMMSLLLCQIVVQRWNKRKNKCIFYTKILKPFNSPPYTHISVTKSLIFPWAVSIDFCGFEELGRDEL